MNEDIMTTTVKSPLIHLLIVKP